MLFQKLKQTIPGQAVLTAGVAVSVELAQLDPLDYGGAADMAIPHHIAGG